MCRVDSVILKSYSMPIGEELLKLENTPEFLKGKKWLIMERVSKLIGYV